MCVVMAGVFGYFVTQSSPGRVEFRNRTCSSIDNCGESAHLRLRANEAWFVQSSRWYSATCATDPWTGGSGRSVGRRELSSILRAIVRRFRSVNSVGQTIGTRNSFRKVLLVSILETRCYRTLCRKTQGGPKVSPLPTELPITRTNSCKNALLRIGFLRN